MCSFTDYNLLQCNVNFSQMRSLRKSVNSLTMSFMTDKTWKQLIDRVETRRERERWTATRKNTQKRSRQDNKRIHHQDCQVIESQCGLPKSKYIVYSPI